jgi:hypothetical protein
VLVSRDGVVKLADFGASKVYRDTTITDAMKVRAARNQPNRAIPAQLWALCSFTAAPYAQGRALLLGTESPPPSPPARPAVGARLGVLDGARGGSDLRWLVVTF